MISHKAYKNYLHLFVLVAFAVAQPIYDLLGKNSEFLVAHSAGPLLIISMILVLSFGIGIILIIIELIARQLGNLVQRSVHLFFVFFLVVLVMLPLIKKGTASDVLVIGGAGLAAFIFTVLYTRSRQVSLFLTILSPAVIIFPLWFILGTSATRLVLPQSEHVQNAVQINNPVPVVLIVFDEFTTTALLDSRKKIDPIRFPHFAALADEGTWYPNAITVALTTTEAIPAIVSGVNPDLGSGLAPTSNDYPKNLFTMLGGNYQFNVVETQTALCPEALCTKMHYSSNMNSLLFFSDLLVIYGYLIAPPCSIDKLPNIGTRWTGFGKNLIDDILGKGPAAKHIGNSKYSSAEREAVKIDLFLSNIAKAEKPVLNFLHVLLPHVPYSYLASGQRYVALQNEYLFPMGISSEKEGFFGRTPLILTGYHRYLQQVGYADHVLGKIRDKLLRERLYDSALVIVTADHGVAFEAGYPRRGLNESTKNELLKIPMFVKLPHQKDGSIDDSIVTIADILPTIINVVKADVLWELDGFSMIGRPEKVRRSFNLAGYGHLGEKDILPFSRLEWQFIYFGEHTPLNKLTPKGPYHELTGRNLDSFEIREAGDLSLGGITADQFHYVDKKSQFLPSLFWGYIRGAKHNDDLAIAVSVNGTIRLTAYATRWNQNEHLFSLLLPPANLRQGRNNVRVHLIQKENGKISLSPIPGYQKIGARLRKTADGEEILAFPDGKIIPVEKSRNNMTGFLDRFSIEDNMLNIAGWAADVADSKPASHVLVFRGDSLVWQGTPNWMRNDVAEAFDTPSLSQSGYRMSIPLKAFAGLSGSISIIALSENTRAFRLYLEKDIQGKIIEAVDRHAGGE